MRGDTLIMYLEFTTLTGKPIPLNDKVINFTMRTNTLDNECHIYDLHFEYCVPDDHNAAIGRAIVSIPANMTKHLLPDKEYMWDFQFQDNTCELEPIVFTAGHGPKFIERDLTTGECNAQGNVQSC
jgi:hypothetical protein